MKPYPTLQEFFKAVKDAEVEDPKLRTVKKLFEIIQKAMQMNSRIVGHYTTRTAALTSFDWTIEGDFEKLDAVKERNKRLLNYLISQHANTAFYGATLYETGLNNNSTGSQIILKKKFNNTEFDHDLNKIFFYNSKTGRYEKEVNIEEEPFLILDAIYFYSKGGVLRSIMPIEIIRFDMILENANWLRKLKGILQIINKGAGPEDEKAAESAARTAIRENFLISSDMVEFKLNEIAGQGGAVFKDFIDFINKEIAIGTLGQANTTELPNGGGSRAALQIQALLSADIFYSDMVRVEALCNSLLLKDYKMNYGKDAVTIPYAFKFRIAEEQDIEKNAAALVYANKVIDIKKDEAYSLLGFTKPENGDDVIKVNRSAF